MADDEITTIKITKGLRDDLLDRGKKSETYEELLKRMIDRLDEVGWE